MDFIERIFGIPPVGGSGSLELLLFLIPLAGIAYLAWRAQGSASAEAFAGASRRTENARPARIRGGSLHSVSVAIGSLRVDCGYAPRLIEHREPIFMSHHSAICTWPPPIAVRWIRRSV